MTRRDDTVVLIPAAGRVPDGVLSLSNISCPAMIPVAGRPVIHWTLRYLTSIGLRRFSIAVPDRGLFVETFVDCTVPEECAVDFIVPSEDGGVGRTLYELAAAATGESALVVLGDTHFRWDDDSPIGGEEPFVLVHDVEESYRWCVVERQDAGSAPPDRTGTLRALHDKVPGLDSELSPQLGGRLEALIGVYYFPDLAKLRAACETAVAAAAVSGSRVELAPILEAIHRETPIRIFRADEWLDCGNPDRQASSHRSLLEQRAFNRLKIDPVLGTIEKRSENGADLRDEVEYLRSVPSELSVLFPRVLAHDVAAESPRVTLEYYGYPTLSEIFLYDRLDAGIWDRIFEHLFRIVTEGFMQVPGSLPEDALSVMYLEKTRARLERFRSESPFAALLQEEVELEVNGARCPSWTALWPRVEQAVTRLERGFTPTFVHGDLHLGNILYDVRSGICKLIDPRGRFGERGVFGDPRYDVAKLYHSLYGLYDLIVADLFSVSYAPPVSNDRPHRIELRIRQRPQHETLARRFAHRFFERFDRDEIVLLTGLLFVSMTPLHYDARERQLAMYARGMSLLAERFPGAIESAGDG